MFLVGYFKNIVLFEIKVHVVKILKGGDFCRIIV